MSPLQRVLTFVFDPLLFTSLFKSFITRFFDDSSFSTPYIRVIKVSFTFCILTTMFYSHEVLTSSKYGVATVWLVATQGTKSSSRKINRKAILDVDVPKACQYIVTPEAPMALRLQSNLLYGVSRVYSQQCGYVLADAQIAQNNIRALLKIVRTAQLDPEAGKARADQIMLQDDPAFLPELAFRALDIDLSALDLSSDATSHRSSLMSQRSLTSSQSSHQEPEGPHLDLIIPTSDTGGAADVGGFVIPGDNDDLAQRGSRLGAPSFEGEEEGIFQDVDFEFDAEGNVVELSADDRAQRRSVVGMGGSRLSRDSAASGRVRREHEEGLQAMARLGLDRPMDFDMDMLNLGGDYDMPVPEAEPFPDLGPPPVSGVGAAIALSPHAPEAEEPTSESAGAPLRPRRRVPKVLERDETQELRNSDLAEWNNNYLTNMANVARSRQHYKANAQAKKNAAFWVTGAGIGGIGSGLGISKLNNPLDMFSGTRLIEALRGGESGPESRKRSRSAGEEGQSSDSEERRVRAREDDGEQIGRGQELALDYSGDRPDFDDDGIEVGRDAPAALGDISSQMPWNITASAQGSRVASSVARGHGFPTSMGGFATSTGGPSPAPRVEGGPVGALSRPGSRMTSASPLFGRGQERLSSLELPGHGDETELLGGPFVSDDHGDSDGFQLYGPGAGDDIQTAASSQWMRAALDQDSSNFLDFVKAQIGDEPPLDDDDEERGESGTLRRKTIQFEELLPPAQHTKMVAAQALHHVLALATKNLLQIQQTEGYRPIVLSLVAGA